MNIIKTCKKDRKYAIYIVRRSCAGFLIGLGLACGFIPLLIASLIEKRNMVIEIIDRMDSYWRETDNYA